LQKKKQNKSKLIVDIKEESSNGKLELWHRDFVLIKMFKIV